VKREVTQSLSFIIRYFVNVYLNFTAAVINLQRFYRDKNKIFKYIAEKLI